MFLRNLIQIWKVDTDVEYTNVESPINLLTYRYSCLTARNLKLIPIVVIPIKKYSRHARNAINP